MNTCSSWTQSILEILRLLEFSSIQITSNKRGTEFRISFNCRKETLDVNDRYINVVIPFDKEVGKAVLRVIWHSIGGSIMALSFLQRRRAQKAHKEQQKNHTERDCEVLRRFFANNHPKVYESGQVCPLCRKRKIWPLRNRVVAIAVLFYQFPHTRDVV